MLADDPKQLLKGAALRGDAVAYSNEAGIDAVRHRFLLALQGVACWLSLRAMHQLFGLRLQLHLPVVSPMDSFVIVVERGCFRSGRRRSWPNPRI